MLWFLWEVTPGRPLLGVATTVLAFAYVGGLGGFAGLLLASNDGVGLILGVALCTIAYDVVGFFVGSQFGKSPIAPKISPNKTVEGTLAGMIGSVLMGWLSSARDLRRHRPVAPARARCSGCFVAVGAFLGDLCESMIKRDLGLKDFGIAAARPRRRARPLRRPAVLPADRLLPRAPARTSCEDAQVRAAPAGAAP